MDLALTDPGSGLFPRFSILISSLNRSGFGLLEPRTRFELVTLAFLSGLPRQCSGLAWHLPG
jgi:hypothetical protein